jgi:class 3 adenylate cyclase
VDQLALHLRTGLGLSSDIVPSGHALVSLLRHRSGQLPSKIQGKLHYNLKVEKLVKQEFVSSASLDSKALIAKTMMSILLPQFVHDSIPNILNITGETQVYEDVGEVSILFCDIADFDNVVKNQENTIVTLLDRIFKKFDECCYLRGIQKIETVGKTYMAAGGITFVENNLRPDLKKIKHVHRLFELAKDMMDAIKEFEGLKLKIGIHVGKPAMGIIGYHKPQFSLIGDPVNMASRHCTTGMKDMIMVSADAYNMMKEFNLESRGYSMTIYPTKMKGVNGDSMVNVYRFLYGGNQALRIRKMIEKIINDHEKLKDSNRNQNLPETMTEKDRIISILSKVIERTNNPSFGKESMFMLAYGMLMSKSIKAHAKLDKLRNEIAQTGHSVIGTQKNVVKKTKSRSLSFKKTDTDNSANPPGTSRSSSKRNTELDRHTVDIGEEENVGC